ncbi:AAT family amino acid transporter [Aspergillus steynii IBT 23096]|uniref:AAT family amino acid transporter n=1 Tax=Aspergillus steynii IBT 23096 TaxID=1392250 RepID=A0A2I2GL27_9EURO|nr:AAT family amino acid transporter [Aspergillus steynii IBT 23096]PLB53590.1 AAT family amino acid transporter [Aspergillus steynii IBT 23096]
MKPPIIITETDSDEKPDSFLDLGKCPSNCANGESLQRHLSSRQVQMVAIGGSIGTALFITIGNGVMHGAGSLLIGFVLHAIIMAQVNNALAEMTIFMPVSAAFIQHASAWVDQAWGFMIGWNFCIFEGLLIPFEITALNMVLTYWRDDIPSAAVISVTIFLYLITNAFAVKYFGEAEFWLSSGKVLLILILYLFTFVTMVGGNPQRDAYGFRNWNKPAPFVEHISTGSLGRFQGVLVAIWQAAFTIAGPEYLAAVAGETKQPRKTLRAAFKSVYWRFAVFFIGGALCAGIICPANDPTLLYSLISGETGTGASSPFVIAMKNMKIEGLPHVVNALLVTTIYSAGDAYVYTTSRSLLGLAENGHAPQFLRKCTKNGVPIYGLGVALAFACLAYLQLGSGSTVILSWLTNLITGGTLVTYITLCVNYLFFYRALSRQGYNRSELPYCGWFQPWGTWIALAWLVCIEVFYGYEIFLKGRWDTGSFFSHYTMAFLAIATFCGWKFGNHTRSVAPEEADLVWARPAIDHHEATLDQEEGEDLYGWLTYQVMWTKPILGG